MTPKIRELADKVSEMVGADVALDGILERIEPEDAISYLNEILEEAES